MSHQLVGGVAAIGAVAGDAALVLCACAAVEATPTTETPTSAAISRKRIFKLPLHKADYLEPLPFWQFVQTDATKVITASRRWSRDTVLIRRSVRVRIPLTHD